MQYALWPFHISGEWFNLLPQHRSLVVNRIHAAEQAFSAFHQGNGPLCLLCGRPAFPTQFRVPDNGPHDGWVYGGSPNWGDDSVAMQRIVNDAMNGGHLYNLSHVQNEFVRDMWQMTKIGTAGNLRKRFSAYFWSQCLTRSFFVDAARSTQQRPDERRRQSEILGFLANAQPGSAPAINNDRHISGEWMRCSPQERVLVRERTHDAAHNQLEFWSGTYEKGAFNLEVSNGQLNSFLQFGLVTNTEVARNNQHYRNNLIYV